MGRNLSPQQDSYDEALLLLSRACLMKFENAGRQDFLDALTLAISRNLPSKVTSMVLLCDIMEICQWPSDQEARDRLIGRFARENILLLRKGRASGLKTMAPVEIETLSSMIPPLSTRDYERQVRMRQAIARDHSRRPCIALFDEAADPSSMMFESVRMVLNGAGISKCLNYLASYVRLMIKYNTSDEMIELRIKTALLGPSRTLK